MSVRFFKVLGFVFIAHLVLTSVVWIGFSAPLPRPPAAFVFVGALPAQDTGAMIEDKWQNNKTPLPFVLDHGESSYVNHWIELRDPSRSPHYAHLGF